MSLESILLLVILGVVLTMFFLRNRNTSGSNSLLVQLNEVLRNEIQEIRKDVAQNAQSSRIEIEGNSKPSIRGLVSFRKVPSKHAIAVFNRIKS